MRNDVSNTRFEAMRKDNFQIGSVAFKWGDQLTDIKAQLAIDDIVVKKDKLYPIDKKLIIKLPEIWSIKTNSCEFSAPDDDRLIHKIEINIAADNQCFNSSWLKIFIKHPLIEKLKKQLGQPTTHRVDDNSNASVVENATWLFDNCDVGISIYGAARKKENGEANIGLLYITLKDIELLDSLYSKPLRDIENFLSNRINPNSIKNFKMSRSQPNSRALSLDARYYPTHSIDFISRALNGFYNRALFQTPLEIQAQINSFKVCIWQATTGEYYLSNTYETIALTDSLKISWSNLLPAKGSGHSSISIGDFSISNEHSRPETQQLITHLEKVLNIKISCYEAYDC